MTTPIACNRHVLHISMSRETNEKLEYAQALMSHIKGCDLPRVFDRALDTLIAKLEKDRCGAATRSRRRRPTLSRRHIPVHVKDAVWRRDGGRCTYTTETGQRCPSRQFIQYDHIEPVARGGTATIENIRLRCRTHNQFEAEQSFGAEFMAKKREGTKRLRAEACAVKPATPSSDPERDVTPWLRQLRFQPEHIRLAAEHCDTLPDGMSLDDRVREAIRLIGRLRFQRQAKPIVRLGNDRDDRERESDRGGIIAAAPGAPGACR